MASPGPDPPAPRRAGRADHPGHTGQADHPDAGHARQARRPRGRPTSPTPAPAPTVPSTQSPPTSRTVTIGTVAWLVVLGAVALVQLSRHAWADAVVLLLALVGLVVALTRTRPHRILAVAHAGPAVIGAAVLAGVLLLLAPRHGAVAGFVVAAAGAGALVYAWPDRSDDDSAVGGRQVWDRPTSRTAFAWSAAWVAGCLWELAMFLLGGTETDGRDVYPAASDLLDPLLAHPLLKALFVVVWLATGVGLLARTDRR